MPRWSATQSLSHWKRFRTNWKHCDITDPGMCEWRGKIKRRHRVGEYLGLDDRKKAFLHSHFKTHLQRRTYHLALSLSSPPISFAWVSPQHLPGFLCGAPEYQMLIRSAGHFAPGPPPQVCVEKWNCSGRSTGSTLYCCQVPVRPKKMMVKIWGNMGSVFNDKLVAILLLCIAFIQMPWLQEVFESEVIWPHQIA